MIDIHSHILPELDDGARSWDECLGMARAAAADGVKKMVATPHYDHPHFHTDAGRAREAREELGRRLRAEGIPLEVVAGGEVTLTAHTDARVASGAVPLLGSGPYFLLELCDPLPRGIDEALFRLRVGGWQPILAHVERERTFQRQPEVLHRLVSQGALCQVTAQSLTGRFGARAEKAAKAFLGRGMVHFVASDAHGVERRPPGLGAAAAVARRLLGSPEAAQLLVEGHPAQVLAGAVVEVEPPLPPRKGWLF